MRRVLAPLTLAATTETAVVDEAAWPRWDGPVYTLRPLSEAPGEAPSVWIPGGDFAARMAEVDIARLAGSVVHPTDRSPVRPRTTRPVDFVLFPVVHYGVGHAEQGNAAEARRALAWAQALMATGGAGPQGQEVFDVLRQTVDEMPASP